jgi:hypothetical protein
MKILETNKSRTVRIPFVIFEYFCKIISKNKKNEHFKHNIPYRRKPIADLGTVFRE